MAEVVMVVAGREFEQPVAGGDVYVGIADEDVGIADVRSAYREPQHAMVAGGDAAFDHAAGSSQKGLVVDDPAVGEALGVHDQVRRAIEILDVSELRRWERARWPVGAARGQGERPRQCRDDDCAHVTLAVESSLRLARTGDAVKAGVEACRRRPSPSPGVDAHRAFRR